MMIRTITTICSSTNSPGPEEGIDHLFLLPERVLGMDGVQLRKDLAALDFKVQLLQSAPSGNVWLSGGGSNHEVNGQLSSTQNSSSQNAKAQPPRTKDSASQQQIDRDERLRIIKEKQNEERQRKLEELKQQALAAQKFRERTEEERRRRIEDLRNRENDRRHQVEERKRLIMEAEKDRREAILRRNMEREARIESKKKMERSSIVFAFGSSTPRMLEPTDSGSTYWASRRATSTTNVMSMSVACPGPLTRRSSERELANGNKKRATSAGGLLDRKGDDRKPLDSIYEVLCWDNNYPFNSTTTSLITNVNNSSICGISNYPVIFGEGKENNASEVGATLLTQRSAARRKTDLMPTVPSRDATQSSCVSRNSSVCSSRRSPGRAFSMTRLDQLSQPRKPKTILTEQKGLSEANTDMSKSMTHLAGRSSGGGSGGSGADAGEKSQSLKRCATSKSMVHLGPPRMTRAERLRKLAREGNSSSAPTSAKRQATSPPGSRSGETTPRPQSALSQHSGSSGVGPVRPRPMTAPSRKARPNSIAVTGVTSIADSVKQSGSGGGGKSPLSENRPPVPKVHVTKKYSSKGDAAAGRKISSDKPKSSKSSTSTTPKETPIHSPTVELSTENSFSESESGDRIQTTVKTETTISVTSSSDKLGHHVVSETVVEQKSDDTEGVCDSTECDMTGSMTSSQIRRITTEEEAKAALAERRRLAREQAEREAKLEQQRLEAERLAEEERLRREEEEQRRMEEEQLRLLEEAKKSEEERLRQAIEEAKKREEEERQRKEAELKSKLEKEEAERKAKEEAERQRIEKEERQKKEEEARLVRKKRVEDIMSRTRANRSTPKATPTKDNNSENNEENLNGVNNKEIFDNTNNNSNEQFLISERGENGSSNNLNSKQNGVHSVTPSNVTSNLLDLSDFDVINTNMISGATVSSQIIDIPVGKDNYNSNKQDISDLLS
ncbi:MAP7 domain-containing protein 2-like isoform X4 [Planococcus citri]|uniref:MAP7 domain-containing protein 2-like isoform X4 n=1 Tax=Planococcus citri TaxID=170843 RepID=UPI0031F8ABE5